MDTTDRNSGDKPTTDLSAGSSMGLLSTRWSLINRLKNPEDQASWTEFFQIYWRLIYAVSRRSGLSKQEAEDVVQETIFSVLRTIKDFRPDQKGRPFKVWLLRLTRWRIVDQYRARPRSVSLESLVERCQGEGLMERKRDPSAIGEAEDQFARIWDEEWRNNLLHMALEKLKLEVNPKHFQIFFLHVIKHRPVLEVSEMLNVSLTLIYVTKYRLTSRYKELLRGLAEAGV